MISFKNKHFMKTYNLAFKCYKRDALDFVYEEIAETGRIGFYNWSYFGFDYLFRLLSRFICFLQHI